MPQANSPDEQQLLDNVAKYGLHIVNIIEEDELPPFSFTVGLVRGWQHPEVLVYGLPDTIAGGLLNAIADRLRAGDRFENGVEYDGLLVGYRCTFRTIPPAQHVEHLGIASWFYDHAPFPAIQLIYPDKSHRWPWSEGVADAFRRQQQVLADV